MYDFKNFTVAWEGKESTIGTKIKKLIKKPEPAKYKIVMANYKIRSMISKLDVFIERLRERDRALFEKVVDALITKDTTRATMYANEIAEIRKMVKQLTITQVALEQISLRLETVEIFGNIMTALVPVIGVVKELKGILKGVMPTMSFELAEVEEVLRDVVIESGSVVGTGVSEFYTSPEARKILEEAKVIAEQRMKEKFPELPSITTPSAEGAKAPT